MGALGMPEFFSTTLVCATVVAQMRVRSWRDSRVVDIEEVSTGIAQPILRAVRSNRGHSTIDHLLVGTTIDVQFITLALLLCGALAALVQLLHRVLPFIVRFQMNMLVRTTVAYSTGTLWGVNMLVVSWFGSIISRSKFLATGTRSRATSVGPNQRVVRTVNDSRRVSLVIASLTRADRLSEMVAPILAFTTRTQDDDAYLLVMNLTMMTDPIVFRRLRHGDGVPLLATRARNGRFFLLPPELLTTTMDVPIDWDELQVVGHVCSSDLAWWQLLQSG
ncbi:hypothetical protein P43SY_011077 [Pythium insidiosum]|uniref:Transmembrane protein n=1 Tax=Pythium insidiosum TaxID=114742 RepID=A0AAD5Q107_PYTIN|nr:hypothetical protein P43SY_011077 [Pythium insidiosum]